jgi:hypothetical protein
LGGTVGLAALKAANDEESTDNRHSRNRPRLLDLLLASE